MRVAPLRVATLAAAFLSSLPVDGVMEIPTQIMHDQRPYYFYPQLYDRNPGLPSPYTMPDGIEIAVVCTTSERYAVFDVTVANGDSLDYRSSKDGCGFQLQVDKDDFPTLAATGLHSEQELARTLTITGKPVAEITRVGRPLMSSQVGFLAQDEDIISVLMGDNALVRRLGLTHPELARPLYHIWNIVHAHERVCNRKDGSAAPLDWVSYYGRRIHIGSGSGHGWQESIFNDEVLGMFQIEMWCSLTDSEMTFLRKEYSNLTQDQMDEMVARLTRIHTGEMVPYYIMRYGFYEGHTGYRADPVAIAFMFDLLTLQEIERALDGALYDVLTRHHTSANHRRQD